MTMFKRILMLVLTLALVLSMVPAAVADEADVQETDVYVLERPEMGGTESNLLYVSPYSFEFDHDGNVGWTTLQIYAMHNTKKNNEVIPAYCVDKTVEAVQGTSYRRLNLEDSSYANSVAGKIRAIMLNGFYITNPGQYTSDADHQTAIDAKVSAISAAANQAGYSVTNLTMGETISATQLAIWQVIHGSSFSITNFARNYFNSSMTGVLYGNLCKEELVSYQYGSYKQYYTSLTSMPAEMAARIPQNISTIYNYLLSLDPVAPTSKVVSPSSFISLHDPVIASNDDGSYDVSVTATVDVQMAAGDTLTLKADLKGYDEQNPAYTLTGGEQEVTLTFEDIPAEYINGEVTLSISGEQTASGVFLFDAEGDRGVSQTMVGMDNSRLPVYAEVVAQESRVLKFLKTNRANGAPLKGIIFDIHPVATLEKYLSGEFDISTPEDNAYPDLATYSVITDANGQASLNLTQHGLPDGVYLVVERDHPAIVKPVDPFYVIFPAYYNTGNAVNSDYEVLVKPKNEVKGGVSIGKDVISLGNDSASVNAGANHTWIISASIPGDLANGNSYVISDTLDNRLDYMGNLKVTVETKDGQTVAATLTAETDYILTVTDVDSLAEGTPSDSFTVALTAVGMGKVADAVQNSTDVLRVYFDAKINANAEVTEEIPNQSSLRYTNSVNYTYEASSDKPVVYTGAANLLKVDSKDSELKLSGAVFEVYRKATQEEIANKVEGLTTINGTEAPVIKASFYDNAAMTGDPVSSAATKEGKLAIYGLAYGDYYLVETQAPAGYNTMDAPKELTISETSHTEDAVIVVENVSGTILPATGGIGTGVYTLSGMVLVTMSLLLLNRKRRACDI